MAHFKSISESDLVNAKINTIKDSKTTINLLTDIFDAAGVFYVLTAQAHQRCAVLQLLQVYRRALLYASMLVYSALGSSLVQIVNRSRSRRVGSEQSKYC